MSSVEPLSEGPNSS